MSAPFDTLINGGLLLDGTGAPARRADLALHGDRIAAIGDLTGAAARQVVGAAGLTVCPGFIDAHSHSDAYVLIEPDAPSKLTQGVTTEIVGQCGSSAAPIFGGARVPADWAAMSHPALRTPHSALRIPHSSGPTWSTVAEYCALFGQVRPAVNVAMLVGHNLLRAGVMGYESRPATADEVTVMARRLEQALDEGGSGLSTGLIYQPGRYSTPDEVLALARVAAGRGGFYATHMRSEGDRLLEALEEVLAVGRATGIRLQISHLKTSGEANWGKLDAALEGVRQARAQGLVVHADRYPYVAGCTDLDIVLPDWAAAGGRDAILARLADAAMRRRIADELDATRPHGAWEGVRVGGTVHPDLRTCHGRSIASVASERHLTAGQAIVWILSLDELRTSAFFFGMSERNLRRIYAEPWVMVGSDASIRSPQGPLAADHPHPRAYGTFPRFLRMAQDEGLLSLAEAVRRCTSLPAEAFGLQGRGRLAAGAYADIVLFDPASVRDHATYEQPHQFSSGVRQVWVNGRCGYASGRFTGDRGGAFLQSRF